MPLTEDYIDSLSFENIKILAARSYQQGSTIEQFNEDLLRLGHVKKILSRMKNSGDLNLRLLVNHLIILGNVFGPKTTSVMVFYKVPKEFWSEIKTVLCFLSYMDRGELYDISLEPEIQHQLEQL